MNFILKYIMVFFLIVFSNNVYAFEFSFGKKFLNYGNGAINLDLVTYVNPNWNYKYSHPGDDPSIFLKDYAEDLISEKNIKNRVSELYDVKVFETLDFYFISINTNIKFDNFTLTILPETVFFKIPDCNLIDSNQVYSQFYNKTLEYFEVDNCPDLRTKQKALTSEGVNEIKNGLLDTIKYYEKVVSR